MALTVTLLSAIHLDGDVVRVRGRIEGWNHPRTGQPRVLVTTVSHAALLALANRAQRIAYCKQAIRDTYRTDVPDSLGTDLTLSD